MAETFGVPVESLHTRGHWHNDARGVALYLARRLTAASVVSLGARDGGVGGQAASRIVRHVTERLQTDPRLARAALECENRLAKK